MIVVRAQAISFVTSTVCNVIVNKHLKLYYAMALSKISPAQASSGLGLALFSSIHYPPTNHGEWSLYQTVRAARD